MSDSDSDIDIETSARRQRRGRRQAPPNNNDSSSDDEEIVSPSRRSARIRNKHKNKINFNNNNGNEDNNNDSFNLDGLLSQAQSEYNNNNSNDLNIENDEDDEDPGTDYKNLIKTSERTIKGWERYEDNLITPIFKLLEETGTSIAEHRVSHNEIDDENEQKNKDKRLKIFEKQSETIKKTLNKILETKKNIAYQKILYRNILNDLRNNIERGSLRTENWQTFVKKRFDKIEESPNFDQVLEELKKDEEEQKDIYAQIFLIDDINDNFDDIDDNNSTNNNDNDNSDDDDEDMTVVQNKNQIVGTLKCPLTSTYIKFPVITKSCKHTMEKEALLKYCKDYWDNGEDAPCPWAGCHDLIQNEDSFKRDVISEQRIKRAIQRQEIDDARKRNESQINEDMIDMTLASQ